MVHATKQCSTDVTSQIAIQCIATRWYSPIKNLHGFNFLPTHEHTLLQFTQRTLLSVILDWLTHIRCKWRWDKGKNISWHSSDRYHDALHPTITGSVCEPCVCQAIWQSNIQPNNAACRTCLSYLITYEMGKRQRNVYLSYIYITAQWNAFLYISQKPGVREQGQPWYETSGLKALFKG